MTKFIVVRHGNSVSNIDKTFTGHIDAPLSEVGLEQAARVSKYIFENYQIDKIYSSDLSRAVNTVKPFAEKVDIEIIKEKDLREIYGGKWEGVKFASLPELFAEDFKVWQESPGLARPTGGESYREAQERVVQVFNRIAEGNPNKTVVVATHGGLIRALECYALSVPLEEMSKVPFVVNASVSEYEINNGQFRLLKTNLSDFLGDLQTAMPKGI